MTQTPNPISLQSALLGDVVRALTIEPRDDSTRRATMYILCAAIESILWMLQRDLLSVAGKVLSSSQRAILAQKPHILRENGKVGRVPSKVNLKQRMQFSAAIVAALLPGEIQFDETGRRDLQATLDVRDRLGHPEKPSDLDVTDAELEAARVGVAWFLDNIVAMVQSEGRGAREIASYPRSVPRTASLAPLWALPC